MENYVFIARSVTHAQRMQYVLTRGGLHCQVFRAPRELTELGCAYAVQIPERELSAALTALHAEQLSPIQVFLSQRGFYREVHI